MRDFIIWLITGGIAGWLAGQVVRGSGFGLIGDVIVGIIGGFIAGWLFGHYIPLPIPGPAFIAQIVYAFIGAVILLIILRLVSRK